MEDENILQGDPSQTIHRKTYWAYMTSYLRQTHGGGYTQNKLCVYIQRTGNIPGNLHNIG